MLTGDWILAASLIASGLTLVGGLLMYLPRAQNPRFRAANLLIAAVAMVSVSLFQLIPSSFELGFNLGQVALGLGIGFAVVASIELVAKAFKSSQVRPEASSALIVAFALILHNLPEGAATVSAAQVDANSALFTSAAIGLHNIPEGLTIAAVALAANFSQARIWLLITISALAEAAGTVLIWINRDLLALERQTGFVLLVVAGLMIAISSIELIPKALKHLRVTQR